MHSPISSYDVTVFNSNYFTSHLRLSTLVTQAFWSRVVQGIGLGELLCDMRLRPSLGAIALYLIAKTFYQPFIGICTCYSFLSEPELWCLEPHCSGCWAWRTALRCEVQPSLGAMTLYLIAKTFYQPFIGICTCYCFLSKPELWCLEPHRSGCWAQRTAL